MVDGFYDILKMSRSSSELSKCKISIISYKYVMTTCTGCFGIFVSDVDKTLRMQTEFSSNIF